MDVGVARLSRCQDGRPLTKPVGPTSVRPEPNLFIESLARLKSDLPGSKSATAELPGRGSTPRSNVLDGFTSGCVANGRLASEADPTAEVANRTGTLASFRAVEDRLGDHGTGRRHEARRSVFIIGLYLGTGPRFCLGPLFVTVERNRDDTSGSDHVESDRAGRRMLTRARRRATVCFAYQDASRPREGPSPPEESAG
jgi:hypothetical protein